MPLPAEPAAHAVTVGSDTYLVKQLTESTWTASSTGNPKALANTPAGTAALRLAVEKTSGCKVTDSDYSREGKQFDAQVNCPGSRKN